MQNIKDLKSNAIFACNHSSETDVFLLPGSLPFWSRFSPIFYTSREKAFYINSSWRQIFYGGLFFKAWGAYPIHPGMHNYEIALQEQVRILRDGGNLCIYPEGKRTNDGTIKEARGGVAYLSNAVKLPVVPVRLSGNFHIRFADLMKRKVRLSISFGVPMYDMATKSSVSDINEYKDFARKVMEEVKKLPVSGQENDALSIQNAAHDRETVRV